MITNHKNGFDFVKANPTLHPASKRLQLTPQASQMLCYFDDLIHELTDELMRYLKSRFLDTQFIANHIPSKLQHDPKMPLVKLLNHCFPILFGLQQRTENNYQKILNHYLKTTMSDIENKLKEKVFLLIHIFHQLAESQQIKHIIAAKAEQLSPAYSYQHQLTALTKNEIQTHCNNLSKALDQGRFTIATNAKEQNILAGLISRTKGFYSFTEKKLSAYCEEMA